MDLHVKEYACFFENLRADDGIEHYKNIFAKDAIFEDPFQRVQGIEAIYKVFEHMFTSLQESKFKVLEIVCGENIAYLKWEFIFYRDAQYSSFEGVSRVVFDENQKVLSHIDYWDAAQNVYEKIPLLGSVLRYIKGKISA